MAGQPGAPTNLRPYGYAYGNAPVQAGTAEEAALRRAADKLQQVRGGYAGDVAAGFNKRNFAGAAALSAVPAALFVLLAIAALNSEGGAVAALVLMIPVVFFTGIPLLILLRSRPSTPKVALTEFYRAVAKDRTDRALALLTNADRDDTTRRQPLIANLGQPSGYPLPFGDKQAFARYWSELLRSHTAPYCLVKLSKVRVQQLAPDVAVVDFRLTLTMNTQLWWLLILVALLIALIVDLATRKVVKADLRKVLVKVGDEWKLFNGEWQGYEEYDLRWLAPE